MATPQQKRAQQRRDAAYRARAYRGRHRTTGRPLPRDCDAALVEALSFYLAREREALAAVAPRDVVVPVQELLKISRRLLVARAGMDMTETTDALKRRISPRDEHTRADFVPSLAPSSS